MATGWNDGLCQDYDKGLGRWFANRLGARQQLRQDFEMTQVLIDRATLEQLVGALEKHHKQETRYSDNKRRANATCAHFTVNPLQELAEQAYMLTHGKETIEALTAGRAALANAEPTKGPITNHIEMANKALRQAADHSYKIAMATRYARTLPKDTL